jgi:hypothetical protein
MIAPDFEQLTEETIREDSVFYVQRSIPCDADNRCVSALSTLQQLTDVERNRIIEKLSSDACNFLKCFAVRMAALSVREADSDRAFLALLAAAMGLTQIDDRRDAIVAFGPVFDGIKKADLDAEDLFRRAGELVPQSDAFLKSWLRRSPEDQSLEAMGYEESTDADGFLYKMIGY